ncbi:MAG: Rpn family recombination-promoting nuclease/putative transposase [Muribaculaceae bacterium]|nr:Rpn family recombination-promoting nuclease/putative transposase [Muribaculaceae bacterium]
MSNRKVIQDPLDKDFIRLLTDFGFKRVFGSKEHVGILKRFLNALFEGEMHIEKVEFKNKELIPAHIKGKKVQFDIYCTTDTDQHFILEMQQEESENFSDRILFYISKAIVNQGIKGVEYELDPIYCIVITNFNLSNLKNSLLKDFRILDKRSHEEYSDKFRLIFLSLQEVPEEWEECETELIRQLYLIKNMENLTKESKPYLSGEYNDFFTASMTDNLTEEEAVAYSESYLKELDRQSAIRFTAKKSREEGIEIGEAKGKEEERRKSIGLMLSFGISAQQIAENYEMPLEEVLKIAQSE